MKKSSRILKKSSDIHSGRISDPIALAKSLARRIDEKKGADIVIFDLRNLSPITDCFIIANGLSDIHIKSIANYLMEYEKPNHVEGLRGASWVLLDFIDVIVHLFLKETREFYGLERLWGDATRIELQYD
jgi:ribosome-associated protein